MKRLVASLKCGIGGKAEKQIGVWDWLVFICFAIFSYFVFNHVDLLITAQHSYAYLDGNILDFYSACFDMNQTYSANYFPSTFVVFALWNLPLKILGFAPTFWGDWSEIFVLWNKLLPVGVYILSAVVIYRLCTQEFEMDSQKAKVTMYIFLTAPVGFFSQFIFGQYDIFTVFFILVGLRFYYSNEKGIRNQIGFLVSFGLAITFKYYAVLVFIVLLFLKTKNVWKIIVSFIGVGLPFVLQFLIYFIFDRKSFCEAVLGFGVLEYMDVSSVNTGFASIKLLPLFVCLIAAGAYFTAPKDKHESIGYGIYYSSGMFFALFSFMKWHPQWLLIAVPFWILGTCINRKYEIFLWLDSLFFVVFIIFVVNTFPNGVDQSLLKNGVFLSALQYSDNINRTMADIFIYKDKDMLFSILVVLFAVYFIYNHPKYQMKDLSEKLKKISAVLVFRFAFCILLFIIPAMSLLPDMLHMPEVLWSQTSTKDGIAVPVGMNGAIVQYATIQGDSITDVFVQTSIKETGMSKKQSLILEIQDIETGKVVGESRLIGKNIANSSLSHFKVEDCVVESGKQYKFVFKTGLGMAAPVYIYYGTGEQTASALYNVVQKQYDDDYIEVDGQVLQNGHYHVVYQILGHYRK